MKTFLKIFFCSFLLLITNYTADLNCISKFKYKVPTKIVTATTYTVHHDSISYTASGFRINSEKPAMYRIIAISRDLLKDFEFGERVLIEGVGKYSGIYTIRDLMNKRWKNKIDILLNPKDNLISYHKVRMTKLE